MPFPQPTVDLPDGVVEKSGPVVAASPLADGCISRTRRLVTADGRTVVLKERADVPGELYRWEAEGLDALRSVPGWQVPAVLGVARGWLLLEDLGPQVSWDRLPFAAEDPMWETFGRALAHCHGQVVSRCGWRHDTYWGLMRMDNRWCADGYEFYAEQRFRWFLRRPVLERMLTADDRRGVDRLAERLPLLVPRRQACLNHGDLWAGNRARTVDGRPAVIDPFIQYGWDLCDLHNIRMFGGFPPRFIDAYRESHPLDPEWVEQTEVFDVLHLLGMLDQGIDDSDALAWLRRLLRRFT